MSNKTIIYIVAIIVLISAGIGYFLWDSESLIEKQSQEQEQEQEQDDAIEVEEVELVTFTKDDFEIQKPETWSELTPPEGIKVLLTSIEEEQIDSAKEKYGFRTYLAITYDTLQGKTIEEFVGYVKDILVDSLPSIEFVKEETITVNGRDALALEAIIIQEGYQFNSLLVMINGEGDDMWTLSFNTSEVRWESLKGLFYKITNSFKLK